MTNEEAKEYMKKIIRCDENAFELCAQYKGCKGCPNDYDYNILTEVEDIAIEALEKQIPKKPNYEHCTEMYACCPSCVLFLSRKVKHLYCPECGQAIDWTEEGAEE